MQPPLLPTCCPHAAAVHARAAALSDPDPRARARRQINAEKSPFLTERLRVWMLPTLALVKLGKTVDYVVGFADLGGSDDFPTAALAARWPPRARAPSMLRPTRAHSSRAVHRRLVATLVAQDAVGRTRGGFFSLTL